MDILKFIFVILILIPIALFMLYLLNSLINDIPARDAAGNNYQGNIRSRGGKKRSGSRKPASNNVSSRQRSSGRTISKPMSSSQQNPYKFSSDYPGHFNASKPLREVYDTQHNDESKNSRRSSSKKRRRKSRSKKQ